MGTGRFSVRDFEDSPFPVTPIWDGMAARWHAAYPEGIPPRIQFAPVRVDRLFESAALRFSDRIAIRYFNTNWTYLELYDRVRQVAGSLRKLGIQSGDRVMLVLPNQPEFVIAWFALHVIGAEVVPANPLMAGCELAALAENCQAKAVLGLDVKFGPVAEMSCLTNVPLVIETTLSAHLPMHLRTPYLLQRRITGKPKCGAATRRISFESLYRIGRPVTKPAHNDVDRPAVLQPTGGTTGSPKLAILTHRNLCANVAQLHVWSGLEPGTETFLSVLPFFHVYGATCAMLSPLAGGATLLLQARFDAVRTLKLMQKWQPGVALLVPFMMAELNAEMRKRGCQLDGLRQCMSGASSVSEDIAREFNALTGAEILEGFGLSEASPVTHSNPPNGARLGSIGLPLPSTEVRIVDLETGLHEVAPGEIGEMAIRGPQVMQGYLNAPLETANALRNGWLFTGDLARMSDDGYFAIVDRKKDMIISGGLNVYPSEVEAVIRQHPSVADCAVVGLPDPRYGERVCVWLVAAPRQQIDIEAIRTYCKATMSGYKVPREFQICDALPASFLGKLRRVELRNKVA